MWAKQIKYDAGMKNKLERINIFLALYYVSAWLQRSNGSDVAINDLQFNHQLLDYKAADAPVAETAMKITKALLAFRALNYCIYPV